jgi:Uma2 family endonuclease
MAMPHARTDWTVEKLHELPDDSNRYEVIDGALLVSPSPSAVHQRAAGRLHLILAPYASGLSLEVFVAPAAITWSPTTEVQPDLLAVALVNGRLVERFDDVKELALAVEVLSPSTTRTDRFTKRRESFGGSDAETNDRRYVVIIQLLPPDISS